MSELAARLVARTKALGLVAATAAVTTALAGGGVVAVTAVSNDKPVGSSVTAPGEQRSATATATIGSKPTKPAKPPVQAPTCGAAKNHGAYVSGVAKSAAPGPSHGPKVAAAAKDACGKKVGPAKVGGPAKAGKPAKPGRPDSPGKSGKS